MEMTGWSELPTFIQVGRHYSHAPIVEAVVELKVSLPSNFPTENLASALRREGFSQPAPLQEVTTQVTVDKADLKAETGRELVGFACVREDERRVVRITRERFSFSWLKPYDNWHSFSTEALLHLFQVLDQIPEVSIQGLSLRFINRIDIPSSTVEVRDYLRTGVDVSPYLPQLMLAFISQVDLPLPGHDATARVISGMAEPEHSEGTSLILDIDVWRHISINPLTPDGKAVIQAVLDDLRTAKNYVFEACITDATRGLIN